MVLLKPGFNSTWLLTRDLKVATGLPHAHEKMSEHCVHQCTAGELTYRLQGPGMISPVPKPLKLAAGLQKHKHFKPEASLLGTFFFFFSLNTKHTSVLACTPTINVFHHCSRPTYNLVPCFLLFRKDKSTKHSRRRKVWCSARGWGVGFGRLIF